MPFLMRSALLVALSLAAQEPSPITAEAIDAAIARGMSDAEIKPARVGRRAALVRSALQYELGRVYTPSDLIALEARAAKKAYKAYTRDNVTPDLAQDVLVFIVPPRAEKARAMDAHPAETIVLLPKGSKDPAAAVRPVWTKVDVATYQNAFGATWQQATTLAAFRPQDVTAAGVEFAVVYRDGKELRGDVVDKIQP